MALVKCIGAAHEDRRPIVDFLWIVVIQSVALLAVIELFVQCMPGALRRASQQNCYRVDGTKSDHRAYREWRARNRLRRDMLAVLILVFLTGNALFFTMENRGTSVRTLGSVFWNQIMHKPTADLNKLPEGTAVASTMDASHNPTMKEWLWPTVMLGSWATGCFVFVGWGAYRAYRSFAEGVNARSAEHFHLDMTRMSVSDSQFIDKSSEKGGSKSGADVA